MTQSDPDVGKALFRANLGDKKAHFYHLFTQLGLTVENKFSRLIGSGTINGRSVTITVAPRTRNQYITGEISYRKYMGMILTAEVETAVQTRFLLSKSATSQGGIIKFFQSRRGNSLVEGIDDLYPGYMVWAKEPSWVQQILGQTAVRQALRGALYEGGEPLGSTLQINADGSMMLTPAAIPDSFSLQALNAILQALFALAAAGEAYPPQIPVQLTWLEKQPRQTQVYLLVFGFLFGIPALLFLFCMLPALVLILMFGV